MPEAIIKAELWETFGSRSEYLAAPMAEAIEQRCRIIAKHLVEQRKNAETEAELEEQRREVERSGRR